MQDGKRQPGKIPWQIAKEIRMVNSLTTEVIGDKDLQMSEAPFKELIGERPTQNVRKKKAKETREEGKTNNTTLHTS